MVSPVCLYNFYLSCLKFVPILKLNWISQWNRCSTILVCNHRLIKITNRTLDVVFSRFGWNSFTITLKQKPRRVLRSLCLVIQRRLRETPLGFCLRVILNEFHPNLEIRVPYLLFELIYVCNQLCLFTWHKTWYVWLEEWILCHELWFSYIYNLYLCNPISQTLEFC